MTRVYAEGTSVSVEKTRAEIDALLSRHHAVQRGIVSDDDAGRAAVMFVMKERQYRLEIPLPKLGGKPKDGWDVIGREPRGWWGWDESRRQEWQRAQWNQACRERWRAVLLLIKAKLELVRIGVSTIEREFLADLVLPNGETLHTAMADKIVEAVSAGKMPKLLLPEAHT